jgi:hypothetical protein
MPLENRYFLLDKALALGAKSPQAGVRFRNIDILCPSGKYQGLECNVPGWVKHF